MRLTASERAKLVDEPHAAKAPRWLSPGAIGCALSHWRAYQRIGSERDEVAVVLEDDAILPVGFAQLVAQIAKRMRDREVLLLYFRSHQPCKLSEQGAVAVGRHRLLYPVEVDQLITTTAYLVTRSAARSLAEGIVPVRAA